MSMHILPLSAAAETLPVLFGKDGDFEGAPCWRGPVMDLENLDQPCTPAVYLTENHGDPRDGPGPAFFRGDGGYLVRAAYRGLALDLRIPSVAARVAGLCRRAAKSLPGGALWAEAAMYQRLLAGDEFTDDYAVGLADLFLALAPRIAALGVKP